MLSPTITAYVYTIDDIDKIFDYIVFFLPWLHLFSYLFLKENFGIQQMT